MQVTGCLSLVHSLSIVWGKCGDVIELHIGRAHSVSNSLQLILDLPLTDSWSLDLIWIDPWLNSRGLDSVWMHPNWIFGAWIQSGCTQTGFSGPGFSLDVSKLDFRGLDSVWMHPNSINIIYETGRPHSDKFFLNTMDIPDWLSFFPFPYWSGKALSCWMKQCKLGC